MCGFLSQWALVILKHCGGQSSVEQFYRVLGARRPSQGLYTFLTPVFEPRPQTPLAIFAALFIHFYSLNICRALDCDWTATFCTLFSCWCDYYRVRTGTTTIWLTDNCCHICCKWETSGKRAKYGMKRLTPLNYATRTISSAQARRHCSASLERMHLLADRSQPRNQY